MRERGGKLVIFVAVIAAVLVVGLGGMVRGWELQRKLACAEQMKRIGAAMRIYGSQTAESGAAPFDWLVQKGEIESADLRCPSAEHANYVLVKLPTQEGATPKDQDVVMYEPLENHGDGGNILFADSHVSYVRGDDYRRLIEARR